MLAPTPDDEAVVCAEYKYISFEAMIEFLDETSGDAVYGLKGDNHSPQFIVLMVDASVQTTVNLLKKLLVFLGLQLSQNLGRDKLSTAPR